MALDESNENDEVFESDGFTFIAAGVDTVFLDRGARAAVGALASAGRVER